MRFVYYNIWLPWSAKVDSTPIGKTIIFDGKLWLFKQAYRYESFERTPIWEYPKIGPWFEIMTSVDVDLRSGHRLETGRRSESIIYIYIYTYLFLFFYRYIHDTYESKMLSCCNCILTVVLLLFYVL
jgi:hypothetical protein